MGFLVWCGVEAWSVGGVYVHKGGGLAFVTCYREVASKGLDILLLLMVDSLQNREQATPQELG